MLKKLSNLSKNKYIPYIVIAFASFIISIVFFTMNLSEYNEARIHIVRIVSIKEVILDKIFPCFISQKHMLGFGYALNIFYGPLTTYIPILISFITNDSIIALKIFTFITILLSGITMYNFLLKVSKKKLVSLLGAIIYISAPDKQADIYSRNAVGEYTAFIFIPLVFEGLYELIYGDEKKHFLLIIGAVGLILSHTITTIFVALFSLIYLIINIKNIKFKKIAKYFFIDFLIIILLTAFYLIPLLEHKVYGDYTIFDAEEMNATGEYVQSTGLSLKDFFASEFGDQEVVFSFGIVMLFSILLTPFCIKKKKDDETYLNFLLLAILALYMCTKAFPWIIMPRFLTIVQFAWRLEGLFIFFISYICAENIASVSKMLKDNKNILSAVVIICAIICSFVLTTKFYVKDNLEKDRAYEQATIDLEKIGPYNINRDYLPVKAINNISYMQNREDKVLLLNEDGKVTIEDEQKDGLNLSFNAKDVENAILELPYIYYHGYTVKINDKKIATFESENGFVEIHLNEAGKVNVSYTGTVLEKIGFGISGITVIGLIANKIIKNRRKN